MILPKFFFFLKWLQSPAHSHVDANILSVKNNYSFKSQMQGITKKNQQCAVFELSTVLIPG